MRQIFLLLVLVGVVCCIYAGSLQAPFYFDDYPNIVERPEVRMSALSLEGLKTAAGTNRQVARISFALNYYIGRYNPFGYHLFNCLIHIITALLLYFFFKTTIALTFDLNNPQEEKSSFDLQLTAFIAALMWAVHPVQVQSVTYIVQRMNSMAGMFYVLSLLLYCRARLAQKKPAKTVLFAACIVAGILSYSSKEIAATLPLFVFLFEWYFFQGAQWVWLKRRRTVIVITAFITVACLIVQWSDLTAFIMERYARFSFTPGERVLTELRVMLFYVGLLVLPLPSRLNIEHEFAISHSLVDPLSTLLALAAITALAVFAITCARRFRLLSFCVLWYFGNLLVESSIIGLDIVFEHRLYVPSMMPCLVVAVLLCRHVRVRRLGLPLLGGAIIFFCLCTYARNRQWSDRLSFWQDAVSKSPQTARVHHNLARALAERGREQEAVFQYREAVRLDPGYSQAHSNLGLLLADMGRTDEAIKHYTISISSDEKNVSAYNNLANLLMRMGRFGDAERLYDKARSIMPNNPDVLNNQGFLFQKQGDSSKAEQYYRMALKYNPDHMKAHYNLGTVYEKEGRFADAARHFSEALRQQPAQALLYIKLGLMLHALGRLEEAVKAYKRALVINQDNADAHYCLAVTYEKQGLIPAAVGEYQESLRLNPGNAKAHNNLGKLMFLSSDMDKAVYHFRQALRLMPDSPTIKSNLDKVLTVRKRLQR